MHLKRYVHSPLLSDLVRIRDCSTYKFKYQNVLQVPQVCTRKYGKKSFRFAAAVLWNNFPDNFRQVSSFNQFKALNSNWSGENCKCNLCRWLFCRNSMFVVGLSVLFSFVCFILSLMLMHDGSVLAPSWPAGLNMVYFCVIVLWLMFILVRML